MMRLAQRAENREIVRREANLHRYSGGKYSLYPSNSNKSNSTTITNDNKTATTFPIRMIMLRGAAFGETKKEGPSKRLFSDAEFQAKREKGLCFKCDEKYYSEHKCKVRELRELRMFVVRANSVEEEIIEDDDCE